VLDNFGDADDQEGVPHAALDKNGNVQGETAEATGAGLDGWDDVELAGVANSLHETDGVELSWSEPNVLYRSGTGGFATTSDHWLSLRVAQFFEDVALNPANEPVDFFVTLSDGSEEATVRAGSVALIPYPDAGPSPSSVMRTVRLPLSAFQAANLDFNPGVVRSVTVRLIGRFTGHILADDLEFSR
jgi:hypothetical protein